MRILIIITLFFITNLSIASTDLVLNARVATTLSGVNLYPDSTYEKQSVSSFKTGELLEVIDETTLEYEDASQNQKFKWYKVKSLKGKEGWVYGDGIAVMIPEARVDEKLKSFHKKKLNFKNGFEKSILWVAGIEGRDNFHQKDFLNPPYKEYYIVVSNEKGNCMFINFSSENARGDMKLRYFLLHDTTGDGVDEVLIQTSSFAADNPFENRTFEIFSFQTGGLNRIFEERMSLPFKNNTHSPALFKYVEVDHEIVRIAYIDYLSCKNSKLGIDYGDFNKKKEHCMEYVTYTYGWNERTKQYRMLYKESRTPLVAGSRRDILTIKDAPSIIGKSVGTANRSDRMEIIKHHERKVIENGVQRTEPYFFVKLRSGISGYIKADEIGFIDIEHSELLNYFYQSAKPDLKTWMTKKYFLNVVGDNRSSYSGIKQGQE